MSNQIISQVLVHLENNLQNTSITRKTWHQSKSLVAARNARVELFCHVRAEIL